MTRRRLTVLVSGAAAGTIMALAQSAAPADKERVTLRAIMAELGNEYLRITDAILRDDYDQTAESASAIAHHPMPDTVVGAVKKALGSEFAHFDEIDEASHGAALALHDAATRHDSEAMARQAGTLLSKCVECHSQFRIRLRPLSD